MEKCTSGGGQQFAQIANHFTFWKPFFCQSLPQNTIVLKSVKSDILYHNLPQLIKPLPQFYLPNM